MAKSALIPTLLPEKRILEDLLVIKGITKVYYVDDENNLSIKIEDIRGELRNIHLSGTTDKLADLGFEEFDISTPVEEILFSVEASLKDKDELNHLNFYAALKKISAHDATIIDLERADRLASFFPDGIVESLSPQEWDSRKKAIIENLKKGEKLLILFDEELVHAGDNYANRKGQDLIVELLAEKKRRKVGDRIICTLLTHKIAEAKDELHFRDDLISKRPTRDLTNKDFFPLAKIRLDKPENFADGIKKVIINPHIEALKQNTIALIRQSYKEATRSIAKFDTYDFEDTIINKSFNEGIWEPETIIRISDIVFTAHLKKSMATTGYSKLVNRSIKQAQQYAGINYKVDITMAPYSEKLKWRHRELYEDGQIINMLRQPIGNGDIFKIDSKLFVLVAQPCDLMIRGGNNLGERKTKVVALLQIEEIERKNIEKKLQQTNYSNFNFAMEYFSAEGVMWGAANFKNYLMVDIDYLDLCTLNSEGKGIINVSKPNVKTSFLSKAWEARFKTIKGKLKINHETIKSIKKQLKNLDEVTVEQISAKYLPQFILASTLPMEHQVVYSNGLFNFGVERILSLKEPKSSHLLNRFTKHQSRVAEPHDFAR